MALKRWMRLALVPLVVMLAMTLVTSAASPSKADASYSAYCNNQTLVGTTFPNNFCWGAPRETYQLMGWGDHGPVCISMGGYGGGHGAYTSCSGGKGAGVYTPTFGPIWAYPIISTVNAGPNLVHGVVFQP